MESPFANFSSSSSFCIALYLEPYLNEYLKTYQHIITLDSMPTGPIAPMVKRMKASKLSSFYTENDCLLALMRYPNNGNNGKCNDAFMGADDIPSIFGFLQANGYTINTDLVKMMNGSQISLGGTFSGKRNSGTRKLICMFSYSV